MIHGNTHRLRDPNPFARFLFPPLSPSPALAPAPTPRVRYRPYVSVLPLTTMRAYKALRRSMKGEKETKHNISIPQKSAVAIVPPKKVRILPVVMASALQRPPVGRPRSVGLSRARVPAPAFAAELLTPCRRKIGYSGALRLYGTESSRTELFARRLFPCDRPRKRPELV